MSSIRFFKYVCTVQLYFLAIVVVLAELVLFGVMSFHSVLSFSLRFKRRRRTIEYLVVVMNSFFVGALFFLILI